MWDMLSPKGEGGFLNYNALRKRKPSPVGGERFS